MTQIVNANTKGTVVMGAFGFERGTGGGWGQVGPRDGRVLHLDPVAGWDGMGWDGIG